MITQVATLILD